MRNCLLGDYIIERSTKFDVIDNKEFFQFKIAASLEISIGFLYFNYLIKSNNYLFK